MAGRAGEERIELSIVEDAAKVNIAMVSPFKGGSYEEQIHAVGIDDDSCRLIKAEHLGRPDPVCSNHRQFHTRGGVSPRARSILTSAVA